MVMEMSFNIKTTLTCSTAETLFYYKFYMLVKQSVP